MDEETDNVEFVLETENNVYIDKNASVIDSIVPANLSEEEADNREYEKVEGEKEE